MKISNNLVNCIFSTLTFTNIVKPKIAKQGYNIEYGREYLPPHYANNC